MQARLLRHEILPFLLYLAGFAAAVLMAALLLKQLGAGWITRYLGIAGTISIVASFGYSLRKRRLIRAGRPDSLLRVHERLGGLGALLVLLHAGVRLNAWLGWLAALAMLCNVMSGLIGKFLIERARARLEDASQQLQAVGLSRAESEEHLYWDSLTFGLVRRWRVLHFPVSLSFGVLATAHIVCECVFWGWN